MWRVVSWGRGMKVWVGSSITQLFRMLVESGRWEKGNGLLDGHVCHGMEVGCGALRREDGLDGFGRGWMKLMVRVEGYRD